MPFRIALSGLNAASTDLRVAGNNVANAGTTGFKTSRTAFGDIYATTNLGVAANAVGGGVKVTSVDQQFGQGNIATTGNNLDLAISGNGFFRLNDNGTSLYTRAGAFGVDRNGFIVNNQGHRLTGYGADATGNITGALVDLQLPTADLPPRQTTAAILTANLDSRAPALTSASFDPTDPTTYSSSTSLTIYDSLGNPRLSTQYFVNTGPGTWDMYQTVDGTLVDADAGTALGAGGNARALTFDSAGALTSPGVVATGPIPGLGGSAPFPIDIDLSKTSQFGSPFSVNSLTQDGFSTGRLSGVDVSDTGVLSARYTNGQSLTLAQVALANFANPQGLRELGNTAWGETFDSGAALIGGPGTGSLGAVQSGALEGSNVDLTEQLVGLITAQRNFQANAQVITTADAVTQTIINIR
ncbi:MAG: flagellar hook protein FlgE [Porticoccaceae bacterium]